MAATPHLKANISHALRRLQQSREVGVSEYEQFWSDRLDALLDRLAREIR